MPQTTPVTYDRLMNPVLVAGCIIILVSFGIAGTGFGVILAVVGRATPERHRSMALGIATAAGSAGQIVGPPVANALLSQMPWQSMFALLLMRAPQRQPVADTDESMGVVVKRALKTPHSSAVIHLPIQEYPWSERPRVPVAA